EVKMMRYLRHMFIFTGVLFLMYFGLQPLDELFEKKSPRPSGYWFMPLVETSKCNVKGYRNIAHYRSTVENVFHLHCDRPQFLSPETRQGVNFLVPINISYDLECSFWILISDGQYKNRYLHKGSFQLKPNASEGIRIGKSLQIVRVLCKDKRNITQYHDVHYFLPTPEPLEEAEPKSSAQKLSVMVIGIDSTSQMSFLRNFRLLKLHLKRLPHTHLWGYTRIGVDRYDNIKAFLTGDEINKHDQQNSQFLWSLFEAAGYRTVYGEDSADSFLSRLDGQLMEFNLQPAIVEMDNHTRYSIDLNEKIHCTGGRKFSEVLHDFIYKMVSYLKDSPAFSFFWESTGVEEYLEYSQFLDVTYVKLFRQLKQHNILNNTLVLLMSAHGLRKDTYRMSYQGLQEESQPLLMAIYPEWLTTQYPQAIANLKENSKKLVTPFDLHATVQDVLHLEELENLQVLKRTVRLMDAETEKVLPQAISLFLPIPDTRTCKQAGIPSLFCLCYDLTELPTDDSLVVQCSRFLIQSINKILRPYPQCQQLQLYTVLVAQYIDFGGDSFVYELILRVKASPGDGVFESSVRLSNQTYLTSPINRVNRYIGKSHCVSDPYIKTLCHCD
ncbi:hypothetical protein KR018_000934, partial [Drosophila ironensis]